MSETVNERIEANADLVKWCVHVLGPDDVIAAPDHQAAVVRAREMNKTLFNRPSEAHDVLCFAYAAPWPYNGDQHAENLKSQQTADVIA